MAAHVPGIIVLALGAGALGGPDALRVLLAFTGQSPLVDIAVCFSVVGMITAQLLGAMLLARFVLTGAGSGRGTPPGRAGAAAGADPLAQMSLLVSLAVTFLVTACLTNMPVGVAAATVAGTTLLVRFFSSGGGARNAASGGAAPTPATDTRRFGKLALAVGSFALVCLLVTTYAPPELELTARSTHALLDSCTAARAPVLIREEAACQHVAIKVPAPAPCT